MHHMVPGACDRAARWRSERSIARLIVIRIADENRTPPQPRHSSHLLAERPYETRVFEAIILATPVRPSKCRMS